MRVGGNDNSSFWPTALAWADKNVSLGEPTALAAGLEAGNVESFDTRG